MAVMDQITPIIAQIEAYCSQANISPSTLCVRALGNSRFMGRLQRKIEKIDEDVKRLSAYMAANPPERVQVSQ